MKIYTLILLLVVHLLTFSCGNNKNSNSNTPDIVASSIVVSKNKIWKPGKKIIVSFIDGSDSYKEQVKKYSVEWSKYANVDFVFYDNRSSVPRNQIIDILISFSDKGDNSAVGKDSHAMILTNKHSMNLERFKLGNRILNRFVVLHEFGHALGLEHEHQNFNRAFVIDEKNARVYCKNIGFTEQDCQSFVIEKFNRNEDTYFSVYDPDSIMHYELHPSITLENINFRSNFSLSLLDKIEIAKLYPGRISIEKIKEEHLDNLDFLRQLITYKNCKIEENVVQKIRFNSKNKPELTNVKIYSAQPIDSGDIVFNQNWEEKESILKFIQEEPYCNFNKTELTNFKAKNLAIQKTKNKLGQCFIPLSEEEAPVIKGCPTGSRFQVLQLENHSSLDNRCHLNFESAYKAMHEEQYCQLNEKGVAEFEKKRRNQSQFQNCYIPIQTDGKAPKSNCHESYPWQVFSKFSEKAVIESCFANFNEALSQMKNNSYCKLSTSDAEAIEVKKREQFELSRSRGRCYLENTNSPKNSDLNPCKAEYPWFISVTNSTLLNNLCYSDYETPLKVIQESASCQ